MMFNSTLIWITLSYNEPLPQNNVFHVPHFFRNLLIFILETFVD